jgi:hydrogenase 3 maturation protease
MSQKSWQEILQEKLTRLRRVDRPLRLAVLGIGHELYGDDAAGNWLAWRIRELSPDLAPVLAIEGGPAPENFTGSLRRFDPDLIVLADAALMDLEPGGIRWLDWLDTDGFSASTHTLPLHLLAGYLTAELHCEVLLLGIQPARTLVGEPLTPQVRKAVEAAARFILASLKGTCREANSPPIRS